MYNAITFGINIILLVSFIYITIIVIRYNCIGKNNAKITNTLETFRNILNVTTLEIVGVDPTTYNIIKQIVGNTKPTDVAEYMKQYGMDFIHFKDGLFNENWMITYSKEYKQFSGPLPTESIIKEVDFRIGNMNYLFYITYKGEYSLIYDKRTF